jgi:hypothetical protein
VQVRIQILLQFLQDFPLLLAKREPVVIAVAPHHQMVDLEQVDLQHPHQQRLTLEPAVEVLDGQALPIKWGVTEHLAWSLFVT